MATRESLNLEYFHRPIIYDCISLFPICSELCSNDTIDPNKGKGKILLCLRGRNPRVEKGQVSVLAGAVGMILANDEPSGNDITADAHLLPASHVSYTDGQAIYAYVNSTK